ncbi:MAG: hypothetical protein COA96_16500 [SAR86 cluster bacterium]|uniref:Uncharacterized protein n=1 Tax=SAR86 cluster bacterium TaxID=2030880 RepID=A0A2A5AI12_9GAMM|nr:MAG: hypothetical protein COA96_16500 [SAR86 cluster bacterium]
MAHASGQCWLASFNYQMIVIVHEAIGIAAPSVPIDTLCQQLGKKINQSTRSITTFDRQVPLDVR